MLACRRETERRRRIGLAALVAAQGQLIDPAHADQLQRAFLDVVVDMQVAVGGVAVKRYHWFSM